MEKEPVKVGGGQYSDKSGTIEVFGPTIALDPDMPNAVVYKTAHYFTINGTKHKAHGSLRSVSGVAETDSGAV